MYTTLASLEDVYYGPAIPEPTEKALKQAEQRGFSVQNLGTKSKFT